MSANPWPAQKDVGNFFGAIELGQDGRPTERWESRTLTVVSTPFPLRLSWETQTTVRRIRCHRGVAPDLTRILDEILQLYKGDLEAIKAARMDLYGGCYEFRRARGLAQLSMHSYGVAIDLDPERNGLGVKWEKGKGMMPEEVIEIFEAHGWTWGGRWKTRPDPMHFQAARV